MSLVAVFVVDFRKYSLFYLFKDFDTLYIRNGT